MPRLRTSSPIRALTLALLLCVLALRVAIPTGYMLDPAAPDWPRLIACPADAPLPPPMPAHMAMPMTGHGDAPHGQHHHDPRTTDHPCPFAAASAAVDLAVLPPVTPLPYPRGAEVVAMHLFARPGLGLAAPPPPPTGPPAFT